MFENTQLVSAAIIHNKRSQELQWFLVKTKEGGEWELPKTVVRPTESSVRASLRAMGEQGGMRVKVLEEVGRHGGAAKIGDKMVSQRTIYYLMSYKDGGGEVLEFVDSEWMDHAVALKKMKAKLDREMLKTARVMLEAIKAKKKKAKDEAAAALESAEI